MGSIKNNDAKTCGIILAAGEGKRAGGSKLSRIISGKPMLEHVINAVKNSKVDEILVITGFEREFGEYLAKKYGIKSYHNAFYKIGMSTSLKLGVSKIPDEFSAFLVFLGDMPYIKTSTINAIVDAYKTSNSRIIVPVFNDKSGHPVLLSCLFKEEIFEIDGDIGAREIVKKHEEEIKYVSVDDEGIIKDIDI